MRQNLSWVAVALVLAWHQLGYAQGTPTTAAGGSAPAAPLTGAPQPAAPKDLAEVADRLRAIDTAVSKLAAKAAETDYKPALFGLGGSLLGVVVGGLITAWIQRKRMAHDKQLADDKATHERGLAENRAKLEIGNSIVQWQLKQLSELYGPLHALLRQSNALYRHMNEVLRKKDPARFQFVHGVDFDEKEFQISLNNEWVRFRTIMHIDQVYGRNYGIEPYFDGLVEIGDRIVEVISEKAGYARPEQNDLILVFGKYLAHYSVLQRLHSSSKEKHAARNVNGGAESKDTLPADILVDESAVFPQQIQRLVDEGFQEINKELNEWRLKAAA